MFIPITRGDSYLATFTLYNRDKSIHKMSVGEHLTFTMKTSKNVEEATISRYYGNGILFNQSTNKYEIELDAISTAKLTNIDYPFDIEYVSSMNDVKTLIQGVFKVCLDVTEPNNRENAAELLRISPNFVQNFSTSSVEDLWADASQQDPQNEVFLGDFNISMSYREKVSETITITPTKNIQTAKPTDTDHEIVEVIVNPIPDQYNDTADASASSTDVLVGKTFYGPQGKTEGTMQQYDGTTNIIPDDKEIQQFETQGKYVAEPLIVEAIPVYEKELNEQDTKLSELEDEIKALPDAIDLSDATATANDIARGKTAYTKDGKVEGTLQDRLQWKCDNIKTLRHEFYGYTGESLDEVFNGLDTSKVEDFYGMFYTSSIKYLPSWLNIDNAKIVGAMFMQATRISGDINFSLPKLTGIDQMFSSATGEDLRSITLSNLENVESASNLFSSGGGANAETITLSGLKKITSMSSAFRGSSSHSLGPKAIYINGDTSKVSSWYQAFYNRGKTETIETIDLLGATNVDNMFYYNSALKNLKIKNLKLSLRLGTNAWGANYTDESIINTAKELWDLTGSTSQTLTVAPTINTKFDAIYVKLVTPTAEQIANDPYINNKKPCEVCESADEGAMTLREYVVSKNWVLAK